MHNLHASELHVISVISNPVRYKSRVRLFKEFQARMAIEGVDLWVCEATFGDRPHDVTDPDNPRHIQVRCDQELWLKEALINRAVSMLPRNWKYVAWVDADIDFYNKNWALETLHQLQHYSVVQPFSHAIDLGPHGEVLQVHKSFGHCHSLGHKLNVQKSAKYGDPPFFHPGYAFAWRREAWETVGGMMDFAICGSGDHHMACSLLGEAKQSMPGGLHANYYRRVYDWQDRALKLNKNIGYTPGTVLHHFHGKKADRGYQSRWGILQENAFDPDRDIIRDWQGLPNLAGNKLKLRDDLRNYFRSRSEDSIIV